MRTGLQGASVSDGQGALATAMVTAVQAGACPQCALVHARDEARVARWLAQRGPDARDALGAVCCPAHTWRIWGITRDTREPSTLTPLATLYADALAHLLHDARLALAHVERTGVMRWLQLPGALAPGWFTERPPCPLCAPRERHDDAHDASAGALDDWMARQPPGMRAALATQACGAHRAEASAVGAADAAHARWWLAPGARTQDVAFIRRLLGERSDPRFPDDLCPLCVARTWHERALIAALAAGESFETASLIPDGLSADSPASMGSERPVMRIDPATLCARHTALLRAPAQNLAESADVASGAIPAALIAWSLADGAPGAIRARTCERDCPACAILHAWELARLEGLHRAAGGAALSEQVTARLVWELEHARYRFCAPHLRRLLSFGSAETTWTALGPSFTRALGGMRDHLHALLAAHDDELARAASPAMRLVAATLAGAPGGTPE